MSFCPRVAPGRLTNSPFEKSVYPWLIFQMSSKPSLSLCCTVVLKITAPHDTQPRLLCPGLTVVSTGLTSPGGTSALTSNVGLSHDPLRRPGKAEADSTVPLNDSASGLLGWP